MGTTTDRIMQARLEIALAAGKRWGNRKAERDQGLSDIVLKGPGSADTPKRRSEWSLRKANKQRAELSGVGLERIIGPSVDWVAFSPSQKAFNAARPVARVVTLPGPGYEPQGVATGFMVTDRLLLTNHHVFPTRSDCQGFGVNFMFCVDERGTNQGVLFELDANDFYSSNATLDYALVSVKPKGLQGESIRDYGTVRMIEATGKILTGFPVNIIEHPNGGPRQYATSNNRLVDILAAGYLHYETDTDKGSSGSPVFSDDWELVALHHSGVPRMENGQILKRDKTPWDQHRDSENDIDWIANEGTRVSTLVAAMKLTPGLSVSQQGELDALLSATSDPLGAQEANPQPSFPNFNPGGARVMTNNVFNISGNNVFHIYASAPGTDRAALAVVADGPVALTGKDAAALDLVLEKALIFDPDYAQREGYDAEFLGTTLAMPTVDHAKTAELYLASDYKLYFENTRNVPKIDLTGLNPEDPVVLNYHHYSLVMNKKYRMCMLTASNCDYRDEMRQDRRPRAEFGGESWRVDRRIPIEFQLTDADIYAPAGNFDRGHIVRREDSCWGDVGLETEYANSDTYHWSNCTPQHELFNQEHPKGDEYKGRVGIWGQFEEALAAELDAGGGQAVIFAGPVLDPAHMKVNDFGKGKVHYPLKFWKVAVVPMSTAHNPKLAAYGYVFDQSKAIKEFGLDIKEALALSAFTRQRTKLMDISAMTGIHFPGHLSDAP